MAQRAIPQLLVYINKVALKLLSNPKLYYCSPSNPTTGVLGMSHTSTDHVILTMAMLHGDKLMLIEKQSHINKMKRNKCTINN